ncbi:MAG: tetratricopeptide repeat protein [Bacteroidales bacterium]|nr:tetratricopeptide repeat protein [Bacteroidales bacterium]
MLHTILLHFILLTSFVHLQETTAREADEAYRQGDYASAIEQYEAVLAKQCTSADLYYNLGNAYYRTGQMGLSILNYSRALRLKPTMSDAKENLALAQSHTVDRITVLPKFFLVRWIDTLCTVISPAAWRLIVLILLALVGVSFVAFRLGSLLSVRKAGLVVGIVLAFILLLSVLFMLRSTHHYNARSEAVVMAQSLTVKGSPEAQSVDKLILHEGTTVTISDSLAGWYKITIADGTTGWCTTEDIERI